MRSLKRVTYEALRFGIVGLVSNILLYLLYLLGTAYGFGHKTTMTLLFAVGTLQTFLFNKRWSFEHRDGSRTSFAKYVFIYCLAYLLNLAALWVFVDHLSLPHQIVQGVMIPTIAVMLFLLQKFWVFRTPTLA